MNFESIKSSKFDAFKSSEIMDSFSIIGGAPTATTYKSNDGTSGSDCLDKGTDDGQHTVDGEGVDYRRGPC